MTFCFQVGSLVAGLGHWWDLCLKCLDLLVESSFCDVGSLSV